MLGMQGGAVTWGVDHSNTASGRGRNSVRLTSKASYTHGLVVLDVAHMPGSICGTWPAFWMTGPNWPNSGEIDIIEQVNTASENKMTMHTSAGCSMAGNSCQGSQGCDLDAGGPASFGTPLNNANGGHYAMEWTSDHINVWFFPRGEEPGDISASAPNPSGWGSPTANFQGGSGCDIDDHFQNNQIVFDTTFCGDWAGNVWPQDSTCSALAPTCTQYVQNNPNAFSESYWAINSLKVYTTDGQTSVVQPVVAAPKPSPKPAAPVSIPKPAPKPAAPAPAPAQKPSPAQSSGPWSLQVGPDGSVSEGPSKRAINHRAARHLGAHAAKHHGAHRDF